MNNVSSEKTENGLNLALIVFIMVIEISLILAQKISKNIYYLSYFGWYFLGMV